MKKGDRVVIRSAKWPEWNGERGSVVQHDEAGAVVRLDSIALEVIFARFDLESAPVVSSAST